jgi:hypothetical protein
LELKKGNVRDYETGLAEFIQWEDWLHGRPSSGAMMARPATPHGGTLEAVTA